MVVCILPVSQYCFRTTEKGMFWCIRAHVGFECVNTCVALGKQPCSLNVIVFLRVSLRGLPITLKQSCVCTCVYVYYYDEVLKMKELRYFKIME